MVTLKEARKAAPAARIIPLDPLFARVEKLPRFVAWALADADHTTCYLVAIEAAGVASRVWEALGHCPLKRALDRLEKSLWMHGHGRHKTTAEEVRAALAAVQELTEGQAL